MSIRPYRPNPMTQEGKAYLRLKERCEKLSAELKFLRGKTRERRKCLRCGAGLEWLA